MKLFNDDFFRARDRQHPSETAHALVQAALAGGGKDNVSVIVGQVSQE